MSSLGCLSALIWDLEFASAQSQNRVVVIENVKLDYAQVLSVEPIYQTLRAHRVEERCNLAPSVAGDATDPDNRLSRMVDSVKGLFANKKPSASPASPPVNTHLPAPPPPAATDSISHACHIVEVPREFRRPIAYDVDYVYKGTKYRSRLPEDPGNRLRVRVSVIPYIPDATGTDKLSH